MGPGSDGPLGAMAGMEPHHMNGSLGSKPRKHAHLLLNRTANPSFLLYFFFIIIFTILSGSGDMDGMNKVNVVTKIIFCFFVFSFVCFLKPYVDVD